MHGRLRMYEGVFAAVNGCRLVLLWTNGGLAAGGELLKGRKIHQVHDVERLAGNAREETDTASRAIAANL